ncbi:MAG: hypothetical protein ACSLEW_15105 [Nocardioides sp.]
MTRPHDADSAMNRLPFGPRLRQPDPFSCGASCVVVARMLLDQEYADRIENHFSDEVIRLHARLVRDTWFSRLGTPPWSVAWALEGVTAREHQVRRARWDRILASRWPAALLVGRSELPRHWVLILEADHEAMTVYNPGGGTLTTLARAAFEADRLDLGRWHKPLWLVAADG